MDRQTTVIIGGVAGGASCAARLRRNDENAHIIILERGPHVSFANCGLPYYIGGVIENEDDLLLASPEFFRRRFDIDVRTGHAVTAIDRERRQVTVHPAGGEPYELAYDHLVLSPGAQPIRPLLPGIDLPGIFSLRTVPDSNGIKQWITGRKVRHALVVGGGFIGLEVAENLHALGIRVTLVERADQVMAAMDPEMVQPLATAMTGAGIDLRLCTEVLGFESGSRRGALVATLSGAEKLETDMVVLAIGVRPESGLARDCGLDLGPRGHIAVDPAMRTSDPRIYAVGDAVEVTCALTGQPAGVPLAGPANRQGRLVADVISGRQRGFRGVQGTAVCGAFGLTLAATGVNERRLRDMNLPHEVVYAHPNNHVGYYPGASTINMKLLYDPTDGQVLGAQAVGAEGVERRIDVIAMAIQMRATVFDLEEAELCYAPQYGAAKDPVNMVGMVAANAMRGDLTITHWDDLARDDALVLDVRTAEEVRDDPMPCGMHIPLDELRGRLDELPRDRAIQVVCRVGVRAYNAIRLLSQHGYRASLLSGGVSTWLHFNPPVCNDAQDMQGTGATG
ncbi:FAD-dependent oxidoreductase [Thioalkalivibrio thiocyanodenitrificans]|uniref:FAD-dependent oxidoreductase n=1 Tax=Thioalkalivibrio thiocyanodenitrificans TaxID=243063 RepID=UPI000A0253F1|nr:FAD-dependent oxidoreductase [Thioalkalivibrio thiocyanodenitrificans]